MLHHPGLYKWHQSRANTSRATPHTSQQQQQQQPYHHHHRYTQTTASETESKSQREEYSIILQPETKPISQEQLIAEVKGIHAGLVMVEAKCVEVNNRQAAPEDTSTLSRLNHEQWQDFPAFYRNLLHEHHDFFLNSKHSSTYGSPNTKVFQWHDDRFLDDRLKKESGPESKRCFRPVKCRAGALESIANSSRQCAATKDNSLVTSPYRLRETGHAQDNIISTLNMV